METLPLPQVQNLIELAIQEKVPVETLERLLVMATQLEERSAKQQFDEALLNFQFECPIIKKEKPAKDNLGNVMFYYAPLDAIVAVIKPLLLKFKLSYTFDSTNANEQVEIQCTVAHVAGYSQTKGVNSDYITGNRMLHGAKQQMGTVTYLKPYALCNSLGIILSDEGEEVNQFEVSIEALVDDETLFELERIIPPEISADVCKKFKLISLSEMKHKDALKLLNALKQQQRKS